MATIGYTGVGPNWQPKAYVSYTVTRRFLANRAYALYRKENTSTMESISGTFQLQKGTSTIASKSFEATETPEWVSTGSLSVSMSNFFEVGQSVRMGASGGSTGSPNRIFQNAAGTLSKTAYVLGTYFPTMLDVVPKDAVTENPLSWYEVPPSFILEYDFAERAGFAINNGGYYRITVAKGGVQIADSGWAEFSSGSISEVKRTYAVPYKEENFPVQYTELTSDSNEIYTWTAQIRAGVTSGSYTQMDLSNVLSGSFLYTLENHSPGATGIYPNNTILGLNPLIQAVFQDESMNSPDPELHHNMVSYRIMVFDDDNTLISDTGTIAGSTIPNTSYIESNFPVMFTPIDHASEYRLRIETTCSEGYTGHDEVTFRTTEHQPSVTVTAPSSGTFNLTPQLVALYTDSLAHERIQTLWQIYEGNTLIAETLPGHNNLTPTYNPDNATVWLYGQELEYGKTYAVHFRAQCEAFSWSNISIRTFGINPYTPVATINANTPESKVDTLNPEFLATYTSELNNGKQAHRFEIWNSTNTTLLAKTADIDSSSTSFSIEYSNAEFSPYVPLTWGTTYILKVFVQDDEDIWNVPAIGNSAYKVFSTNTAPSAPTELSPNQTDITTLIPNLTAKFNDPNTGDTISAMEVELRRASDNNLLILRSEAQTTNTFPVFLSDNLVIDTSYIWRVRFRDQGNLIGAWSPWATFYTKEGAQVAFTNPSYNEILTSPLQTFEWTYTHPSGVLQSSGRLRIYAATGNVPIYDSGIIPGSYLSQELPLELLSNNREYRAVATVIDANGEQATTGFVFFQTSWIGPPQPEEIYAYPYADTSTVQIVWSQTDVANFRAYMIYQLDEAEENDWRSIGFISSLTDTSFMYYHAPSGRPIEYAVTVLSIIDGVLVESNIETFTEAELLFTDKTWFMDSTEPETFNFFLMRNPSRDQAYTREAVYTETLGRKHPVVHFGNTYKNEITIQFDLKMPYNDTLLMIERMIDKGSPVMYKDSRGRRMWVALHSYALSDLLPDKARLSLTLQRVDYEG